MTMVVNALIVPATIIYLHRNRNNIKRNIKHSTDYSGTLPGVYAMLEHTHHAM